MEAALSQLITSFPVSSGAACKCSTGTARSGWDGSAGPVCSLSTINSDADSAAGTLSSTDEKSKTFCMNGGTEPWSISLFSRGTDCTSCWFWAVEIETTRSALEILLWHLSVCKLGLDWKFSEPFFRSDISRLFKHG